MLSFKNVFHFDLDKKIPANMWEYLIYVFLKSPIYFLVQLLMDVIHYTRYPIAIAIFGTMLDDINATGGEVWTDPVIHKTIIILLFLSIGESAHILSNFMIIYWQRRFAAAIRRDFLYYTFHHSFNFLTNHFAGSLSRKITELSESTIRFFDTLRHSLWFAMIHMITVMLITGFLIPAYGLAVFIYILIITLPVVLLHKKISTKSSKYADARAKVTGVIVDSLTNFVAYKSFAKEEFEKDQHDEAARNEAYTYSKISRTMAQIGVYRRICIVMMMFGSIIVGLIGYQNGLLSIGEVSQIVFLSFSLVGTTWMLGMGIIQAFDEFGYLQDALKITSHPHEIIDIKDAKELSVSKGQITFNEVEFAYGEGAVFDHLNVDIKPKERIALVGHSGAGKSTFVNLLLRFFDVQGGQILIDGQDVKQVSQTSLRENIAYIPQDTALFHRSLMDNIRYGRLDASDEEVKAAAQKANAHLFIEDLPEGYNTLVGERGIKLSGGQRQRIAIARAILKDAPILILDEATSALDSESEQVIQQSLAALMKNKTVLAIAHRLSTIASMDRILVFEDGKIIEQGAHQELLDHKGHYAKLWAMQSGGFLTPDQ